MRSYLSISLLILVLPFIASAQEEKSSFTLAEAQEYAVENHLRMKNAQLDFEKSKKSVMETTAIGLPQVMANADYRYNLEIPVTVVDARSFDPNAPAGETVALQFGQDNNANASLTATQMIFDGTFFVGLQAAKSYKEFMEQSIDKTEIEIKDMVARAYYNLLIAKANETVIAENVEKLEDQMDETSKMFEAGFVEELDVDQLDLILSDAKKRKQTLERQIDVLRKLLNFQMGRAIEAPLTPVDNLRSIYDSYDENALLNSELKVENHIDYRLIETQEELSLLKIKRDRVSRLPSIGAFYNLAHNSFVNPVEENVWFRNQAVGVTVSMPIFTSTMNHNKVQQSRIELKQLQNEKELLRENLEIQVSAARTAYIDALEQFRVEEKNLNTSQKIFDVTTVKQKNGLASSMDVTIANNQYLQTQGKYINSLYNILDAKATLDRALNNY